MAKTKAQWSVAPLGHLLRGAGLEVEVRCDVRMRLQGSAIRRRDRPCVCLIYVGSDICTIMYPGPGSFVDRDALCWLGLPTRLVGPLLGVKSESKRLGILSWLDGIQPAQHEPAAQPTWLGKPIRRSGPGSEAESRQFCHYRKTMEWVSPRGSTEANGRRWLMPIMVAPRSGVTRWCHEVVPGDGVTHGAARCCDTAAPRGGACLPGGGAGRWYRADISLGRAARSFREVLPRNDAARLCHAMVPRGK